MANKKSNYWKRRYFADKVESVNRGEDFLKKREEKLYKEAGQEIKKEVELLYQAFADKEKITLAEAKQLIREADFAKVDWEGMIRESLKLREQLKQTEGLPKEVAEKLERQHRELEKKMAAYTRRGKISYLELRALEIDRKLVNLYDEQQLCMYDYLKSEWEDGYYRSVFNHQQRVGFGKDFIRPNEQAVKNAILNRYDKRNYSKILYAHCTNFSEDLRENLVTGLIRGENLEKMTARIAKRMDVAYHAARTLVRTETAYIYEAATKSGYEACGIEWYEYLAALDSRTSEVCRELDGKHFKVADAMPGINYPPMHPNCRSTTVCWFPEEAEQKANTTRIAKDEAGGYYEVPADMVYREWCRKNDIKEYRFVGNGRLLESFKQAVDLQQIIAPMSKKVKEALKKVTFKYGSNLGSGYREANHTIYFDRNVQKKEIRHEVGHAIEKQLFDAEKVKKLKEQLVSGLDISDVKIVKGTLSNQKTDKIFIINNPNFVDRYQGRIYAQNKQDCIDSEGNIDIDKLEEFIPVAYQYYLEYPAVMKKRFPEMYQLVKESVE